MLRHKSCPTATCKAISHQDSPTSTSLRELGSRRGTLALWGQCHLPQGFASTVPCIGTRSGAGESGPCCTLEAGRVLLRRGRGWGQPRVVLMPQPPRAALCWGRLQSGYFSHPRPRNQVSAHRGPARWSSTWHAPRKSLLAPARSGAPRAHSLFLSSFKLFPLCSLPFVPPLIM